MIGRHAARLCLLLLAGGCAKPPAHEQAEPAGASEPGVLDPRPAVAPRVGDWDRLELRIAEIERYKECDEDYVQELQRRAEAGLAALTDCLRDSPTLRQEMPSKLYAVIGVQDGQERAYVHTDGSRVPDCAYAGWAPPTEHPSQLVPGDATVVYDIEVPASE